MLSIMKKSIKRVIKIILIVGFSMAIYLYFFQPTTLLEPKTHYVLNTLPLDRVLLIDEVHSDRNYLINTIEDTHPIFLEEVPSIYYEEKERYLKSTEKEMTVKELQNLSARYVNSLNDGHTRFSWHEDTFLEIDWYFDGDNLIIPDRGYVKTINNIPIDVVLNQVTDLLPEENKWAKIVNYPQYSTSIKLLERAGVETGDEYKIELITEFGSEWITVGTTNQSPLHSYVDNSIYAENIHEDIVYIKLGVCDLNDSFYNVISFLEKSMDNGVKNYIIDLQNNPGGNSLTGAKLLETLGFKPGRYGYLVRYSDLAQDKYGYIRNWGKFSMGSKNSGTNTKNLNLYILTNEYSYSSATMLATWVSDGKLGSIVGRPSSNSPSCYGDILHFQLPNSRLKAVVSYKKFQRPDKSKDKERALIPDIMVDRSDDILVKVLAIITNKQK